MMTANGLVALTLGLFGAMLSLLDIGYRIGRHRSDLHEAAHEGLGAIETAIFALLGLLLAFAFSGAMSRLDARRQLIVQEANAIGTAYLRLDLLPVSDQPEMRRLFRSYLDARVQLYENLSDAPLSQQRMAEAAALQQQIWTRAVAASRDDQTQNTARILLPALNEMIDVTTARAVALRTRLPPLILALFLVVACLTAFVAGYAMAKRRVRSWLHGVLYAACVALTLYVVLDLDNPRLGLIRLDATEQILKHLHDSIR